MTGGEIQKVFVNPDGSAAIKCPVCDNVKTTRVEVFKGTRHVLKVKCTCQNLFMVNLEFRKAYRKEIKLAGDFVYLAQKTSRGKMLVVNISKTGLGAQVLGRHNLQEGHELRVTFNLDDRHNSLIDKRVVVRLVRKNYIGCEFLDSTAHDKALGFYLMV